MSIQIRSLGYDTPTRAGTTDVALNTLPTGGEVYNIYTVPAGKAAIIKSIRIANILSQTINISLYVNRLDSTGRNQRRRLIPEMMTLAAGMVCIDDSEITLGTNESIQAKANIANCVHFVISGVERDVS